MKRPKQIKGARKVTPEAELRRWCIEQAIRWPMYGPYGAVSGGGFGGKVEADVIGRAERLLKWVRTSAVQ